ncbi:hypothetical protein N7456_004166 [Penicillium angulare]|uniref:Aminotransferase class I/classII large domain-containing protein n=1 Tax=Penicillium angulare TaxID=116970 RepID=A0A9W9KIY6_9EURO|nr:hypothetical protein N7456_004166 [Penicillium angulare]
MSIGENSVLSDEMIEICKDAVQSGFSKDHLAYPKSPLGDPGLLDVLASFLNSHFEPSRQIKSSHIAAAAGASACLNDLMYSICDSGDGVLVPAPFWNGFDFHFNIRAQVTPIAVSIPQLEDQFTTELISALEKAYHSASRPIQAVVLTNPHNPLGQCYPKEVIEACITFCARRNLHLVSDEVYALSQFPSPDFPGGSVPFTSILSLDLAKLGADSSRVHMIWSISKDFGYNGLRIGCVVSQENRPLILHLGISASLNFSSISSLVAKSLLTSPRLPQLIELSSQRLSMLYGILTKFLKTRGIEYIPASAGLFVFARLAPGAMTWQDEMAMIHQLKDGGVLVGPGRVYHTADSGKGWARLTFSLKEATLRQGLERLGKVLEEK